MAHAVQDAASQTTQVKSRLAWERVMGANSPAPVKYLKTSVLILGWEENADDTRTAEEVRCTTGPWYYLSSRAQN